MPSVLPLTDLPRATPLPAQRAITGSNDVATFVGYALDVALSVVKHREFRRAVLAVLIEIYGSLKTGADSFGQAQCSLFLSDTEAVSALLLELIRGSDDDHLVALQLVRFASLGVGRGAEILACLCA